MTAAVAVAAAVVRRLRGFKNKHERYHALVVSHSTIVRWNI